MARTPMLERTSTLRILGAAFLAALLTLVWLTYAVFNKQFSNDVDVTVLSRSVGLQLNKNADVKLRGVIVGRVSSIDSDDGQARIHLGLDRDLVGSVPSDVEAYIVPKTLFGEKFVDLKPVSQTSTTAIEAGDVIDQAQMPIEVENVLNDIYPLLESISPADLSYTLSALSTALEGQGETIGETLDTLNTYVEKVAPLSDDLVDDIIAFGEVADQYADVMPEVGQILRNSVVTGNTIVSKRVQLQALFDSTTEFAQASDTFFEQNGSNLITLSKEARPTLRLLADYSPTLPCLFQGLDRLLPRIDETFRGERAHVSVEFAPRSPSGYTADDAPSLPSLGDRSGALAPTCASLPNSSYTADDPAPGLPASLRSDLGFAGGHGKKHQTSASSARALSVVDPSIGDVGSDAEEEIIDAVIAPAYGDDPTQVPDLAAAAVAPALRGAEVSIG